MQRTRSRDKARLGAALVGLGGLLAGTVAFAGSPTKALELSNMLFADEEDSFTVEAEAHNLDDDHDVRVSLSATAEVDVACINPAGKEVPSQRPRDVEVELEGFERFDADEVEKYGDLRFEVQTEGTGQRIRGAPDCPNKNWTERVERVRFVDARVTVRQGNRKITVVCSFDPPTKDGRIREEDVDCFTL